MSIFYQIARRFIWIGMSGLLICTLAACSIGGSVTPTKKTITLPLGKITEFPLPAVDNSKFDSIPMAITSGPDGDLWFTEAKLSLDQSQADQSLIGSITPGGKVTEFPLLTTNILLTGITRGPDGNLWFTESADVNTGSISTYFAKIGYITPSGKTNEFLLPAANSDPLMITSGSDGNLWFTDPGTGQIGRISIHGKLSEFPLLTPNSYPRGITAGPDGNIWFTEAAGKIGRISPGGVIKEFSIPTTSTDQSDLAMITSGPDGNLWFTETSWNGPNISGKIGRITPAGVVTMFALPNSQGYSQGGGGYLYGIGFGPISIIKGSDGNLWFTGLFSKGMIGRITSAGVVAEFFLPNTTSLSYGITSGSDGNLWFTESGANSNQIGRITTGK
jgi:virginiamycin B lyase